MELNNEPNVKRKACFPLIQKEAGFFSFKVFLIKTEQIILPLH